MALSSARHSRWLLTLLLVATLAPVAAIPWYYVRQRNAIETETALQLSSTATVKAEQIANWRRERLGDGRILQSRPIAKILDRVTAESRPQPQDRDDVQDMMHQMATSFLYTAAAVVDHNGRILMEVHGSGEGSRELWKLALAAARDGHPALSELHRHPASGRVTMALVVPVRGGALMQEIDAARLLYPFLRPHAADLPSAETFLVHIDEDALFLSDPRMLPGAALVKRRPAAGDSFREILKIPSGQCGYWRDYRGVHVMGVIRPVAGSSWHLVTKVDASEVYAPLRGVTRNAASILVLIGVMNAAAIAVVWITRQKRELSEREEWFRSIANDTPAYLWTTVGTSTQSSFINQSFKDFLGVQGDWSGEAFWSFVHPDDAARVESTFRDCALRRCKYSEEYRIRRFDGDYRWVFSQGAPRFSPAGVFLGYAGALLDISDRRRTEEEVQALSARLIDAQEQERSRIARELHDDLSQQIAAVSIGISTLKREIPQHASAAREQADKAQLRLALLAEAIRRISHALHSPVLIHSGVAAAIRSWCGEFADVTGIRVHFSSEGAFENLSRAAALCVYRVAQEALQNVAKHAQATEARVLLERTQHTVRLQVRDNGIGMNVDSSERGSGLGLVSIRERVRLLNGRVDIQSEPGAGTELTAEIPEDAGDAGPNP